MALLFLRNLGPRLPRLTEGDGHGLLSTFHFLSLPPHASSGSSKDTTSFHVKGIGRDGHTVAMKDRVGIVGPNWPYNPPVSGNVYQPR